MHIYFIGIGGTGVGPLALIASQAGYRVSGSDFKQSEYTDYLSKKGISLTIGGGEDIGEVHSAAPIDRVVSVSAIIRLNPGHPVFEFARANDIEITERDTLLNEILKDKNLKLIAAAGTHGKTTTTAMFVWVFQQLGIPISYSVGAKTSFADMGHYEPGSEYFIYECDEFHRNFLQFYPYLSVLSGVSWDHHEVFPTRDEYKQAFRDYMAQTESTILWDNDAEYLYITESAGTDILDSNDEQIESTHVAGKYNRRNAWLVINAVSKLTGKSTSEIQNLMDNFPGAQRRMEELIPGVYTDYAHTPEKIIGCLSVASEIAEEQNKTIVVVYEPLTNRRQHFMKDDYKDCFAPAKKLFWVPSYLAREDPAQTILSPAELITHLDDAANASPAELNDELWSKILESRPNSIVVCMSGGGGNSLDEWLRLKVREQSR
jgi:UDP-N-acetylmuramate--alanine ligase